MEAFLYDKSELIKETIITVINRKNISLQFNQLLFKKKTENEILKIITRRSI